MHFLIVAAGIPRDMPAPMPLLQELLRDPAVLPDPDIATAAAAVTPSIRMLSAVHRASLRTFATARVAQHFDLADVARTLDAAVGILANLPPGIEEIGDRIDAAADLESDDEEEDL